MDSESEGSTISESSSSSSSLPDLHDDSSSNNIPSDIDDDDVVDFRNSKQQYIDSGSHQDVCKICRDGGSLILCDTCPCVYHQKCLNPPLTTAPEGEWLCPRCLCEPIDGQVRSILTWRWAADGAEEYRKKYFRTGPKTRKYMAQPKREFFVHLHNKSYWDCKWVSTIQMEVHHPHLLRHSAITEEPPQPCDDDDDGHVQEGKKNGLKKRFYDNGVNSDWLQIHRIINDKTEDGVNFYLVKWRELPYEFCTWETEENSDPLLLPEFQRHVEIYKEYKNYFLPAKKRQDDFLYKHFTPGPSKPMTNLKEKINYDDELRFIDPTSGLKLHNYQVDGLNWLRFNYKNNTNTILADEMGLGKTIQAVTFLYSLYKEGHSSGPFLVAVPLSTMSNWEREFEKWSPDLYVVVYTGEKTSRQIIRDNEITRKKKGSRGQVKFHVLLTSYEYITKDEFCLQPIDWSVLILDEAHKLKSGSSKFFQSMANYKTDSKILLTGTPLQNNLEELFHLLNFLAPDKFQSLSDFMDEFTDIGKEDQIKKLQKLLGSHMLRRLKSDVIKHMPSKSELIVRVELTPMQKEYYKNILTRNFEALNSKEGGKKASLCTIFMELKKCCQHPYLFSNAMMSAPLTNPGQDDERYEIEALTAASGKLILLRKMLAKLKEQGHRVLIFSQMTKLLDILEDFLSGEGYVYERIDGSVKGATRQGSIDRFNDPKSKSFVFLLSTKAGGLGINLATADTVIIYDSDWNPHNDLQALSRAHRIGQKNKVMIYRFVTRKSVEERVAQVCKQKMMLTQLVVESNRKGVKGDQVSLSKNELEIIIRFGAQDLFKDEDKTPIQYTDEAIDQLLDRNQQTMEEPEEGGHLVNEYLQSFKVANYSHVNDDDGDNIEEENLDPDYWDNLLNKDGKLRKQQLDEDLIVSGKRKRKAAMHSMKYQDVDDDSQLIFTPDDYEYDDEYKQKTPKRAKTSGGAKRTKGQTALKPSQPQVSSQHSSASSSTSKSQVQQKPSGSKFNSNKKDTPTTTTSTPPVPYTRLPDSYFSTKMYLSTPLSLLIGGKRRMSRSLIRRYITLEIVEANNLYDPEDPLCDWVICNRELYSVFRVKRFKTCDMFRKYLDQHLATTQEEAEEI